MPELTFSSSHKSDRLGANAEDETRLPFWSFVTLLNSTGGPVPRVF
jgi:hypothetical protein